MTASFLGATKTQGHDPVEDTLVDAEIDTVPAPVPPRQSALGRVLLGASLVLIAFNLRPVFQRIGIASGNP